jgi:hypothetical protein
MNPPVAEETPAELQDEALNKSEPLFSLGFLLIFIAQTKG